MSKELQEIVERLREQYGSGPGLGPDHLNPGFTGRPHPDALRYGEHSAADDREAEKIRSLLRTHERKQRALRNAGTLGRIRLHVGYALEGIYKGVLQRLIR